MYVQFYHQQNAYGVNNNIIIIIFVADLDDFCPSNMKNLIDETINR